MVTFVQSYGYNRPFDEHNVEVALSENEFDTPALTIRPQLPVVYKVKGQGQGFFICHMINYTGYNQKWNVGRIRSAQWTVQGIKKNII